MENLNSRHIRKWIYLLPIFIGFSLTAGFSQGLLNDKTASDDASRSVVPVVFSFGCMDGQPGDTICVPITVQDFINIVGGQFEIHWNSSVLDYIEITNPGSPSINLNSDFNLSGPNALKFIPLGFPISGESLPDGTVLFEICFRVIGIPGSISCIGISPFFDFEFADNTGVIAADSVNCCMTVENAMNLVGFITSCGPSILGGNGTIDITAFGGTAPYTITWQETTTMATGGPVSILIEGGNNTLNVPSGNYDVTVTDAIGNTVIYNTDVSALSLGITTHLRHPTCYKFENGTIWIKPEGGAAPFSYIWQSLTTPNLAGSGFIRNPGDSSLVTSLPDGMYTILVRDDNGCEEEITVTLNDNPFIITINGLIPATCNGSADGVITLSISGATPDASGEYIISGNLTGVPFQTTTNSISFGLLDPGEYVIRIRDIVAQCDTFFTFTIGYSDTISATIMVTDPLCAGGNNGSVSIRGMTNGVPGPMYSYSIYQQGMLIVSQSNIGGTFSFSTLEAGTYAVVVTEGQCLSDTLYFTLTDPLPIMVSEAGSVPDNCLPSGSGDIWFDIMNGLPPYILDAGAGFQIDDTLFNLNSGNYILTVTDGNGCSTTLPFTILPGDHNEANDISFQFDGIPCQGGTVTVLYLGLPLPPGVGAIWSNNMTGATIPITQSGTLGVDVFIGSPIFCIFDNSVDINCTTMLELDITVMQPLCGEGADGGPYTGTVIVDTSNAVAPVTFIWSFPDTTTTGIYSGLAPGKYYVTVTDAVDSMAIDSFEIIAPNPLTQTYSNLANTSCPNICDGGVRITPGNGDPTLDYTVYWFQNTPMSSTGVVFGITGLCSGVEVFSITQDDVCFYRDSIELFAPDPIVVDLVQAVDATCYGTSDGMLEVTASGGTPGFTYAWEGGPPTSMFSGIAAGTYTVSATDSNNCIQEDSFTIGQPDTLIAEIDTSGTLNLSCGSSNDGIISLDISGGNPGNYTYTWSPNVSSNFQAVNLAAGNYFVTVSDIRGCTDTTSYELTAPPPIVVDWPTVNLPACFGDETVILIDNVTGGNGNYAFNINGGQLMNIGEPVMVPSGIYVVSVFDDRGCVSDSIYIILEPNPILVSIGPNDPVIDLGDSLFLSGTVVQSDQPIVMTVWTSQEPLSCESCPGTWVFNSLPAVYTWTVTDANGCQGSAFIIVDVDYNRDVYIPNIFSPNGDGRNDEFRIYTGLGVVSINYFNVYDRWGNLVHSEQNLLPNPSGAGNWDGTSNGKAMSPGVYVYVAEITFVDNNTRLIYRGDVTLVK